MTQRLVSQMRSAFENRGCPLRAKQVLYVTMAIMCHQYLTCALRGTRYSAPRPPNNKFPSTSRSNIRQLTHTHLLSPSLTFTITMTITMFATLTLTHSLPLPISPTFSVSIQCVSHTHKLCIGERRSLCCLLQMNISTVLASVSVLVSSLSWCTSTQSFIWLVICHRACRSGGKWCEQRRLFTGAVGWRGQR